MRIVAESLWAPDQSLDSGQLLYLCETRTPRTGSGGGSVHSAGNEYVSVSSGGDVCLWLLIFALGLRLAVAVTGDLGFFVFTGAGGVCACTGLRGSSRNASPSRNGCVLHEGRVDKHVADSNL